MINKIRRMIKKNERAAREVAKSLTKKMMMDFLNTAFVVILVILLYGIIRQNLILILLSSFAISLLVLIHYAQIEYSFDLSMKDEL